ncbi:hypothetical protein SmJEL517_g05136 [Synchytrium microbalum]|uniref:Peroxidase n=1 Tax=Synchytrium microbalum TaxID=1806994 RepID=A0A507C0M2_9FUNG|nr:uncharacterized protein SmJEL517_g05136 [Synchytrium microbalum]TPX31516.1 hypothetical protein SmJEL517_g05136 [Synchytrium microbalum]
MTVAQQLEGYFQNYAAVKKDILSIMKNEAYDDGSLGPILVRLAWHASGTYDKNTKTGGSNGASMRFAPESTDPENNGLQIARAFLETVRSRHPWISRGDLWTLAGATCVEAMGGPKIPWRSGRIDIEATKVKPSQVPENGKLPDGAFGPEKLRATFYRMGFNDREIVALSGAHVLGRCHKAWSGYEGKWVENPTEFSNEYFHGLIYEKWFPKEWDGKFQYENDEGEMMLPSDMALVEDPEFKKYCQIYADNQETFFRDFAAAYGKVLELGVTRR